MSGTLHGQRRYLFVLGHMRAYTSVLAHILGSNPGICGYREHHISYDSLAALKLLRRNLQAELSGVVQDVDYLMDKLLHDNLRLAPFILASPNVRTLFILRNPEDTLSSLIAFFPQFDEDWALNYYTARLSTLRACASSPDIDPARALYLDADSLLDSTSTVFAALENWLGLTVSLRRDYQIFRHSGEPGHGDCSPRLRDAHLHRDRLSHSATLSTDTLAKAESVYRSCRETMRKRFFS